MDSPRSIGHPEHLHQLALRDKWVGRSEYVALVTSNRCLVRADDADKQWLGLLDPVSGVRYVISEKLLFGA
jgi:hypothetical protein